MKFNYLLKAIFIISIIIGINSCKGKTKNKVEIVNNKKEIGVFDFDDKQKLSIYNKLNLDETHPNLLNPQISKSDYNSVMKSWIDLHQRIGQYLSENEFTWGVKDNSITIVQKIYFKNNGVIQNYFFKVLNKDVTKEKKEQFANLVSTFAKDNQIEFKRDGDFAQCGKTKYLNK